MASIAYALSIQHFVNSVGAKAGFASIIGLALLVLLFFTQSRETANLRRRADEAEQQLYQLQLYVDHLSRQRSQHAAAPAAAQTTGAPVAAPPAAAALAKAGASRAIPGEQLAEGAVATLIPSAPAGVGAPALSSATRLIPLADPEEISIRALRPSTNGNGEGPAGPVSDATVATPPPAPPPGPAPSTAAGGGNGVARPPVVPMPIVGPATESAPPPRVALPRQQQRPPARPPVGPPPPRRSGREPSGRRISPVFFVLAAILVAAVIAVVLIFVTGSSNNTPASSSGSGSASASASSTTAAKKSKGAKHKATVTEVAPGSVTVAVLNGTTTTHLAADVLAKLTADGYKGGTTQNASESGLTTTIVGYTSDSARTDALAVAKSLNLGPASVQAVSQGDRLKVCGSTTTCSTQVIVTLGADLSQTG
jgi:hypothetical protein